jgi:hypothetical protein
MRPRLALLCAAKRTPHASWRGRLADLSSAVAIATIVNPDTRTVDVYRYSGFHLRIGWRSELARKSYVGSYQYD